MYISEKISIRAKAFYLLLGFGIIFSLSIVPVYAGSFTVTNYSSSGDGSLRDAIDDLNTSGVSGSITFNESSASGTIDLSGYTTSLGFETTFNPASYDITLTNYTGGCTSWTNFSGATTGVLNIGSGSTWTNTWGLVIGKTTTGALTVSNGGDLTVSNGGIYIASEGAGAVGVLTVTGSGSTLANAAELDIGKSGNGTLTVSAGGVVTNTTDVYVARDAGSTGTLTVTGTGSTLSGRDLYFGSSGNGTVTVSDGGSITGSSGFFGNNSGSVSDISVTGNGSSLATTSDMYIGYNEDCTMTVSAGGDISAYTGFIGSNTGSSSSVTVTGDGSAFTITDLLYVGCWDTGTLNVLSGGDVSNTTGIIGHGAAATGTVTVNGTGSTWANSTGLYVGNSGNGTLTVSGGGAVSVAGGAGTVTVADDAGSVGILNIGAGAAAGTLNAAAVNGGGGTATLKFNHTDGDYDFGLNLTGSLKVEHNNTGITNFDGTNTYSGGTTINAGAIDAKVDGALGTGTAAVNDGGSLLLGTVGDDTGSVTLSNGINVAGDGNTGIGAINNAGGSNTLSGAISTTADTTIGSISGILAITNNITSTSNYDLTFTGEGDIGVQGVIGIGTGGVIKNGTGGLYLSGTNTYTGSTIINAGGIVTSSADALGACSDVTIADNATLVLDEDTTDVTLDNNIISVQGNGPGAYGAIVSTGDNNTISGSITQAGDTTIYSDSGNLTISGAIGGAYGLTLDGAGNINVSGAIGAVAGLAKNGDGILTLSGANTYTGATAVNAGTLKAGIATQAFGAGSDVTVASGATMSLNNFSQTIGSLSGSGTVNNTGAANRTLTVGSTPLGYGDGTSTTFSGLIADGGAGKFGLTKDGTGTLVLSGANTYTGATIIDGGTLQVSNARALGTGAVTNNATLDIGSTTLNIDGVYTQAAGSTLMLSAASASSLGSIVSVSDAVVSSASAVNVAVSGYLPNNATLKVIDGAGGAGVDVPATITSSSSKYRLVGSSVGGDLILTVDRSGPGMGFVGDANNGNAAAVASVLDNMTAPSGNMLLVLDTLENMTPGEVGRSLDTMTPIVDGGVISVSSNSLGQFVGTSTSRLEDLFAQARDAEETGVSAGSETLKGFSVWGRGFGEYIRQEPRGISNGYRATVWGTALGGDIPAYNDTVRLGLSGGYAQSGINSKDNSGKTDIDSYQGTLYAGYLDGQNPYYLNGAFSFAYNEYKGSRHVAAGTIMRTADADYDGQQYSVLLDGGYTFKAGEYRMTPVASLQYTRLHLEGYTETGADALNLIVNGENYDMLQSGLGMKLERTFETETGAIIPEVHAKWLYDFIGDRQETTSVFSGGGGSFATQGFDPAKNSLNAGAKLTLVTRNDWSIETNYDFEYKEDFTSHTGWADIKYRF